MKKKLLILLMLGALLLSLMLVACNTAREDNTIPLTDELISELSSWIEQIHDKNSGSERIFCAQMDGMKSGYQPIYVEFDSDSVYYACAYYNLPDGHFDDCEDCIGNYTWVGFAKETDIPETYQDKALIMAFQCNGSTTCLDLFDENSSIEAMEHYRKFDPIFENGFNIASPIAFDETFVYLTNEKGETVYWTTQAWDHMAHSIPHVVLNGKVYFTQYIAKESPNGTRSEIDLHWYFGSYYDALMEIMIADQYSEVGDAGYTYHYGVFAPDAIKMILSE